MNSAIYDKSTGEIAFHFQGKGCHAVNQVGEGQGVYLNCPPDATHILNGKPVVIPYVPPLELALAMVRAERNRRIAESDWTQLPDVALNSTARGAWAAYRQQLRDFPDVCDPYNPVWPTPP